jgi:phosphoribosylanthranilate isomerase
MRTRIKLCGFRTEETVCAAAQTGADAIGFVFYPPSPRYIEVEQAAHLVRHLGVWQSPVGLFVNPDAALVQQVLAQVPWMLLQFHGDETPEFCESFARPYIKAIRMREGVDVLAESRRFAGAQALLLDAWSQAYGGCGHTFDWSLLPKANQCQQALVLSGGLDCTNVGTAVKQYQPDGVDVSSGIESERGVKSISKLMEFCKVVQQADADLIQP